MPDIAPPMSLGDWDLTITTPIGRLAVSVTFEQTPDGLAGTARSRGDEVVLLDLSVLAGAEGERLAWRQSITTPLRLNLTFDVVVVGDNLTGVSRAGRLPASQVTGHRVPHPGPT